MKKGIILLLVLSLLLSGCSTGGSMSSSSQPAGGTQEETSSSQTSESLLSQTSDSSASSSEEDPKAQLPTPHEYLHQVTQQIAESITTPDMSESEKVKAAFDYLIEIGDYNWPILLDLWRIRSDDSEDLDYLESRALSFLLYGVGACEDYAAALVVLLDEMGIEAKYLPGITYGRTGNFMYHAWTQVKVDGIWYHVDPELEDGISDGSVRYRYYMRSDATMSTSHFWGESLIQGWDMPQDQIDEIRSQYMGEDCPQDGPTPERTAIPVTPDKDPDEVYASVLPEYEAFVQQYGELEYRELDVLPPVFGRYDGAPADDAFEESGTIYRESVAHNLIQPAS